MFRNGYFWRGLGIALVVLGLVATGSFLAYQFGLRQGAGLEATFVMPGPGIMQFDGENGYSMPYRQSPNGYMGYWGHGFFPFIFFGGFFRFFFLLILISMFFRLIFRPWGWRRHSSSHSGHWGPGPWGPGKWDREQFRRWYEGDDDENSTDNQEESK